MVNPHRASRLPISTMVINGLIWGLTPPDRSDSARIIAIRSSSNVVSPKIDPMSMPSGTKDS